MTNPLVVVFLGPPGSGKGTQGKELAQKIKPLQHVATGDLFRNEMAQKSDIGRTVADVINSGQLVSDDLTYEVLKSQLLKMLDEKAPECLIFDGYPRNGAQVKDLGKLFTEISGLKGPVFFELQLPKEVVVERISGRLVNPRTGTVYHKTQRPPKKEGFCDVDGGELIQRPDDKPEVVADRFDVYQKGLSEMLVEIGSRGYFHYKFNGNVPVADLSQTLKAKLEELSGGLIQG
jgi:adenylate kinase